jgi:hypothetical protein
MASASAPSRPGHRFERNSMHGNGAEDPAIFLDASDANFALNTWRDNDCDTDNPPGANRRAVKEPR